MEAKKYLQQVYKINEIIEAYTRELAKLQSLKKAEGFSPEIEKKLMTLEKTVSDDIDKNIETWAEVRKTIESVDNANCRVVLTLRYLQGCTWEEISATLNYSPSQVKRIYFAALASVAEILKNGPK